MPDKQKAKPANKQTSSQHDSIMKEFRSGKTKTAIKKLEAFVVSHPDLDLANDANIFLGDYYVEKDKSKALKYYLRVVNSPYYSSKEWIARLKAGLLVWEQKDSYRSLELIEPIFKYDSPSGVLYEAHKLKAEVELFRTNYPEALKSLVFLAEKATDKQEQDAYRSQAKEITEFKVNRDVLMRIAGDSDYAFLRPLALFKMGVIYFEESNYSKAESYLEDVVSISPKSALAEQANDILLQIYSRSKINTKTIGVVLPLSGRLGPIGYKTLSGIQHGLGIFGNDNSGFKIAVIDSEANPNVAKRAVEKLVVQDNVIAILGSLKGKTSLAIAKKAQELGVPNIGFSLSADLTVTGDYIFRNALTSHMQVKNLVKTAMTKYNVKRFAILYPNDNYGIEFSNIFWDEVLANGGEIRGAQSYNAKETDFRDPIRRLVGTYYREDRFDEYKIRLQEWQAKYGENTRRKIPTDLLPPIVDFEAIFIPDTSRALGQIAPMLEYNDVKTPILLGTNLWNTNSITKRAGGFADQVVFVDTYTDLANKRAADFIKNFEQEFGRKPDSYESIAYETAKLLKDLIVQEGIRTRSALKESLMQLKAYPSIMGQISVNEIGDIERPLRSMTIEKGQIKSIQQ
jgi:ABC-type branched-subunit amino acid transport system substrate-binding protein